MKGLQYAIDLVDRTFGTTIKKSKASTRGLDDAVRKTDRNIAKLGTTGQRNFSNIARYAKRAAAAVGLIFAANSAIAFGNDITNLEARFQGFENAITFASGQDGAKNLQFVNDTVKRLNTDLSASMQGFATVAGALRGTNLEGQATRDIFEGMSIAAATMNLSSDNMNGALVAFGQIASKGKVQAEELRGQLGERIPGAFNIAAKAMGVSQVQLNKMLDEGKLYSDVFLPRFAAQLKKEFSGGLDKAANSMQAFINKKNNAIIEFKRASASFLNPLILSILTGLTKAAQFAQQFLPKLEPVKDALYRLFLAFSPVVQALSGLGDAMGGSEGMVKGLATAINALAFVVEIMATGLGTIIEILNPILPLLGAVAAGWWAINAAMYANPVGLVIAAVVALIGVITYAWNRVGWFRGGIMAAWEAIKGFGKGIKESVVLRFKEMLAGISGIAKAIKLIFQGEWKQAFETAKEAKDNLFSTKSAQVFVDNAKESGKKAANAYQKGVAEAEANKGKKGFLEGLTSGLAPTNANAKFLGTGGANLGNGANGSIGATGNGDTASISGSGTTNKHTTFNIQSLVQNLTVQTTNLTGNPSDVKRQLEQIFLEIMGDIELRANG